MAASYRKIDYSIRPAKHAERRMILDLFRCCEPFAPLKEYVYIGMGSIWFADFILFYKAIGFKKMISIEWNRGSKARLEFNVPFQNIELVHKSTSQALPELDWNARNFLWIDYDAKISLDILQDASTIANNAISGTIVVMSVQCNEAQEIQDSRASDSSDPLELFGVRFGRSRTAGVLEEQLYGWAFGALSRQMLYNEIENALASTNVGRNPDQRISIMRLCELEYADDAKMTSIAFILVSEDDKELFCACNFSKLDFVSAGKVTRIDVPLLTLAEMAFLKKQLPLTDGKQMDRAHIPESDARGYASLLRYLPSFAVLET